jgi:hypothetical protein
MIKSGEVDVWIVYSKTDTRKVLAEISVLSCEKGLVAISFPYTEKSMPLDTDKTIDILITEKTPVTFFDFKVDAKTLIARCYTCNLLDTVIENLAQVGESNMVFVKHIYKCEAIVARNMYFMPKEPKNVLASILVNGNLTWQSILEDF